MRVHIDATRPQALWQLWGMTLLERLLRQLAAAGVSEAYLSVSPSADWRARLRADYRDAIHIMEVARAPVANRLTLELDATAVYDARVIAFLLAREREAVLVETTAARVVGPSPHAPESVSLASLPTYVAKLRRYEVPKVLVIERPEDLAQAERSMFRTVYKGVTDIATKYLYPGLVRSITRVLAPTRITPNQVTAVSMVLSFGAIPAFLAGHLWLALAMGFVMSVLDSVDGKLARLTLRETTAGNWMDHGSDFVYFGLWLVAIGASAATGPEAWLLPTVWLADRLVALGFKWRHKRELNDYAPIDATFRLIVIRRNIFLVAMAAGLLVGQARAALVALTAWTLIGLVFHLGRAVWIEVTREAPRASRLHGGAS